MDRGDSLGYVINHLARLMEQALRDRIARHGVVPGQFAQLLALYEQEGISQQQLCEKVRIDQSTMAHTLKRMERDGLVERTPDPADGRRALIHLTDRSRRLRPALEAAAREVNALATAGFSDAEREELLRLAAQAIGNLEADRGT
ncbi:MarR family winged helix-turn-helix transcriptional regulator [Nocardia rosealba]|uniref:MarR family winged helix-turn-helix transcriptional regulator n=1 Tax=Nocardia rosealba TaxID=2878563 RepID=UPI001CD9A8ED|nr:MarR family transcriptional regulator [Nocardia rosealba]MCA2210628.1 MarR family transcriptional regulator [Nocardia rosealba]